MAIAVSKSITLCDNTTWGFHFFGLAGNWHREFSRILNLSPLTGPPTSELYFGKEKDREGVIATVLSGKGKHFNWEIRDSRHSLIWFQEKPPVTECRFPLAGQSRRDYYILMALLLFPVYQHAVFKGGLPFHAALAEVKGLGVLFAGFNGAGKSTTSRRLPGHWRVLGDDEALAVKAGPSDWFVHPFPTWSECITYGKQSSVWHVEYGVPLTAVFFLEKSKADSLQRCSEAESVRLFWKSCADVYALFFPLMEQNHLRQIKIAMLDNAIAMARHIPCYKLQLTLHGRFWELVQDVL